MSKRKQLLLWILVFAVTESFVFLISVYLNARWLLIALTVIVGVIVGVILGLWLSSMVEEKSDRNKELKE